MNPSSSLVHLFSTRSRMHPSFVIARHCTSSIMSAENYTTSVVRLCNATQSPPTIARIIAKRSLRTADPPLFPRCRTALRRVPPCSTSSFRRLVHPRRARLSFSRAPCSRPRDFGGAAAARIPLRADLLAGLAASSQPSYCRWDGSRPRNVRTHRESHASRSRELKHAFAISPRACPQDPLSRRPLPSLSPIETR